MVSRIAGIDLLDVAEIPVSRMRRALAPLRNRVVNSSIDWPVPFSLHPGWNLGCRLVTTNASIARLSSAYTTARCTTGIRSTPQCVRHRQSG